MNQFSALLQPLTVKGVTIPNRVLSTAHTSGAGEDGKPKERYRLYHEEKARGGIGLTIIGGSTAVAEDTPGADMLHLDASTDEIIPWYRELADGVHAHGAVVFGQLAHMGRRANWDNQHWLPTISPSRVREPAHGSFPKEMEDWDFDRLANAFCAAAGRIRAGGLDGIELSATHGHIFDQFWSRKSNRRTDAYGGPLHNRLRFTLDVLKGVRATVGDDHIVGLRMSGDELVKDGLRLEECVEIAATLTEEGGLDYLSVLGASADNFPAHAMIFPGMDYPPAPYLHLPSAIRRAVGVPVFHAQRISDLATANRAIEEGHVDMVGMTRPHLADPHIVAKLVEGRPEDIRPCIGANYCIDRLYSGGQAYCLHNPATGREQSIPHVVPAAKTRKRAVVVGAGPGGLEAARVLAERGHQVTLLEREGQSGGQVNIAARLSWRESLLMVPRWLEQQAVKLGAEIRYDNDATADDVRALEPEIVIVATGGVPAKGEFAGRELASTCAEVLNGSDLPEGPVLVFDDNGAEAAVSCATVLASRGRTVEFVTADKAPASLLERTTRPSFMRRLYQDGVVFTTDHRLVAVERHGNQLLCRLENEYSLTTVERRVSAILTDYGTQPDETLYYALRPGSTNQGAWDYAALVGGRSQHVQRNPEGRYSLHRIGDAVASRNIHAAIYEARRLCKDL